MNVTLMNAAQHHGDLRNALVAAAVQLVERGGEASFSLREAAREVEVSPNAAYRHFDDKSALMTAAAAEGSDKLAQRMRRSMDRAARNAFGAALTIAHFKAAGRAYVAFATEHPELFRLMFGPRGAESFGSALAEPPAETPWTLLSRCLDALVEDGVLAPERRPGAELAALSVVHGFASLPAEGHAAVPKGRARATAVEALLSFTVVGLCGEIAGPRRRSSRAASS